MMNQTIKSNIPSFPEEAVFDCVVIAAAFETAQWDDSYRDY